MSPLSSSLRWVVGVALAFASGGCTGDPAPTDGPCLWHEGTYFRWLLPPHELRLVAVLDSSRELPADVEGRLEGVLDALRTGDLDADGRAEFDPAGFDGVVLSAPFDEPLWPVIHEALGGEEAWRMPPTLVVLVSTGDISPAERSELLWRSEVDWPQATFVAVAGFPPDIVAERPRAFEEVLEDPRMDWDSPAACTTAAGLDASPARGLATLLEEHEGYGRALSVCDPHWDQALLEMGVRSSDRINPACLGRAPALLPDGRLPCAYLVRMPESSTVACEDFPGWRTPDGSDPRLCELQQLVPMGNAVPEEPGWYIDRFSEHHELLCRPPLLTMYVTAATGPLPDRSGSHLECVWNQCVDRGVRDGGSE